MKYSYRKFVVFLALISTFFSLSSQLSNRIHEQLRFNYLTIDQGLNNNRVRALTQDKYGFIWFGTRFGLSRYDGYALKQYNFYSTDSTDLEFSETNALITENKGNIWCVGVYGICYLDRFFDKFVLFQHDKIKDVSFTGNDISEDANGNLWIATTVGLIKYNLNTEELTLLQNDENDPSSIPPGNYFKVKATSKNHIWFGLKERGAGYIDLKEDEIHYFTGGTYENTLADDLTERIYEDKEGDVWIGHNNNGASRYSYKTHSFKRYYAEPGVKEAGRVRGLIEDSRGNFWFGTQAGLYLFDKQYETFRHYAYTTHPVSILSHNSIQNIYIDKQEGMWLGTFAGGVSFTNLNSSGIIKYEYSPIKSEYYLNDKNVYSLEFDKNNNILVGTENGGINYLDIKKGTFTFYVHEPGNINTPLSNNIKDIYADNDGYVWFGTYKGGMSRLDPTDNTFVHFQQSEEFPQGIDDETIFHIYPDPLDDNILWIGATSRVLTFNKSEQTFTPILPETPGFISVPTITRIYSIVTASDNRMVIGANLLTILDRNANKFINIEGLEGTINFVTLDNDGNVWGGFNNRTIFRLELEYYSYKFIDQSNGLPDVDFVDGTIDRDNNFWLSSTQGLWKINNITGNLDTLDVDHYDPSDNIQSLEFLYNSKAVSEDGEILFGGINGFNSFRPENVKPNPYKPKIIVTKLAVANKEVMPGKKVFGRKLLDKPIMETHYIHFNHKIKIFTFHFTGFHYVAPENNKFKYMLEGYDEEWQYTDAHIRSATYSNIPRGTYTFFVDGTNNNGIWSEDPFKIKIKVTPPFWKTVWFFAVIGIGAIVLVIMFIKGRESQMRRDQEVLENKLKIGQEEIEKSKTEVAHQQEELEQRDLVERKQKWHNLGMVKFSELTSKNKDNLETLTKTIIAELVDYIEAQQGAIFLINDNNPGNEFLEIAAGYALNKERMNEKKIGLEEGLLGACFNEKQIIQVDDIPESYSKIESGLGSLSPKHLLLVPMRLDEIIMGVLEIGSFEKLEEYKVDFIEKVAESVTSVISIVKANAQSQIAMENARMQAEELKAAEEELRQNMEELQATQEELGRKQEALLVEQAMFETLMNFLEDRITFKDVDSNYLRINKVKSDALKLTKPGDAIGKSDADFFGEEHAKKAHAEEKKLIDKGVPILNNEERIIFKDGKVQWGSTSRIPFKDAEKNMVGALIITRNITRQKLLEGDIETRSRIINDLVDRYPLLFYSTNSNGKLQDVSGRALAFLKLDKEEAEDRNIFELFPDLEGKLEIESLEDELAVNYNVELPDGLYFIEHKIVKDKTSGGIVGCAIFNK